MPFRDAGRGPSDFNLSIQDCLWGMWKASQNGLCDMNEFSVEEYEYYEKVENGDWNWITPGFIAFASPLDPTWLKSEKERKAREAEAGGTSMAGPSNAGPESPVRAPKRSSITPATVTALQRKLPQPFLNCLDYFEKRSVRMVVRLNTELYDRKVFLEHGIDHVEMYFDDGTNPTDEITRKFIDLSDEIISNGGAVAVHVRWQTLLIQALSLTLVAVQGWSGSYWDTYWRVSHLEIRVYRQRSYRFHAYRSPWFCGWATTALYVPEATRVDQVVCFGRDQKATIACCVCSCHSGSSTHCHTRNTSSRGRHGGASSFSNT